MFVYMGAGILPVSMHKNKLYFLFGKENKYADTPGWSDFGGGTDASETCVETAVREGGEELTGFLGDDRVVRDMITKREHVLIENRYGAGGKNVYYMHVVPMEHDESLPRYYNNNQRFLQKRLPAHIIKNSKIFEKAEIQWFRIDDLLKKKSTFRNYFQDILPMILGKRREIAALFKKEWRTKRPTSRLIKKKGRMTRRRG
jgi:8-oxo-dGTP pyrophosphatase MutT (NUDIX family)